MPLDIMVRCNPPVAPEVMFLFYKLLANSSDAVILLSGVVATAVLALVVAAISRRLLFSRNDEALEGHSKLAEVVHGSLLAFSVFVLALVLTEVRSNLGKADDLELREASLIARLTRDLNALEGEDAAAAVERVKDYVRSAVTAEWKALAQHEPSLAEETTRAMAALVTQVQTVAAGSTAAAAMLGGYIDKLEEIRQSRLESATKAVPPVFWWVIGVFIVGAMIMNGRHNLDPFSMTLIAFHMGAIGLVVAMILVMDSPFRGETSVSPAALLRAARISSL
jgi:cell division protein FtsL